MVAHELLSALDGRADDKTSPLPTPWTEPTAEEHRALVNAELRDASLGGVQRQRHGGAAKASHWLTSAARPVRSPRRLSLRTVIAGVVALLLVALLYGHDHHQVQRVVEHIREVPTRWRTPTRFGPPNGIDDPLNPVRWRYARQD